MKADYFFKFIVAMLIIVSILGAGLVGATSCRTDEPALVSAYKASVQISAYATSAGRSILKAYQDKLISLETKDQLFQRLEKVAEGGRAFHNELNALRQRFPDGNIDARDLVRLEVLFNAPVYLPMLDVLEIVKLLPADQRPAVELAISALKVAIDTVRLAFSRKAQSMTTVAGLPERSSPKTAVAADIEKIAMLQYQDSLDDRSIKEGLCLKKV